MSKKEFLKLERDFRKPGRKSISVSSPPPLQNFNQPNTIINNGIDFNTPTTTITSNSTTTTPIIGQNSGISGTPLSNRSNIRDSTSKKISPYNSVNKGRQVLQTRRRGRVQTIDEHVSSQLFVVHPISKVLFSCGHWDHTFKASVVDTGRLLQSINAHRDVVTCITLGVELGKTWLVTGSRDCTLMIWEVYSTRDLPLGNGVPIRTLYGHDNSVTSVSINIELDVVVSGSDDGTVIIHSLREGSYIRTILIDISLKNILNSPISPDELNTNLNNQTLSSSAITSSSSSSSVSRSRIHWVTVTIEGYIVVYLIDEHLLCSYTINGRLLATKDIQERLYSILASEDGQVLITGGENCLVVLRWVIYIFLIK